MRKPPSIGVAKYFPSPDAIGIRGATFGDLWKPVASLVAISIVLIAMSARAFQKTVT